MGEGVRLHPRLEAMDEGRPYRRIEVITGRRQRRSYTAEEKARIVAESAAPDANISEVARRSGVNRGLLTVWRREAGIVPQVAPVEMPLFVPVTVAEEPPPSEDRRPTAREPVPGRIEMDLRSGRLVLHGAVDPSLAAAVVAAARGRG
ncbi:transposase [Azorhizobium sp. AG788]|uniref:IS66-like element accessory protein TnpA n=1 Tax=Azorhizobium sp. AG788 TaxID=2183897 RepID=UPI00313A2989